MLHHHILASMIEMALFGVYPVLGKPNWTHILEEEEEEEEELFSVFFTVSATRFCPELDQHGSYFQKLSHPTGMSIQLTSW